MTEGHFIVLEGIDGAGTTTHTKLLINALREQGVPTHGTHEPSTGPVGVMLRQILSGRLVVPGIHGSHAPGWATMALLFAADRMDHVEAEILPNLMDGVTVISDRYDYSSVAYQSATSGEASAVAWIQELNRPARRPDLTIVLDIPSSVAATRRKKRSTSSQLYEDDDLQHKLGEFYRNMEQHFPNDRIVHVTSDRPVEDVAGEIFRHVKKLRGEW